METFSTDTGKTFQRRSREVTKEDRRIDFAIFIRTEMQLGRNNTGYQLSGSYKKCFECTHNIF